MVSKCTKNIVMCNKSWNRTKQHKFSRKYEITTIVSIKYEGINCIGL